MASDYSSEFKEMTSAINNILQTIMNTNHQVWKLAKIIKYMMELELEELHLFETVEQLIYHPNLIEMFFR
jgi:hypothetical protein